MSRLSCHTHCSPRPPEPSKRLASASPPPPILPPRAHIVAFRLGLDRLWADFQVVSWIKRGKKCSKSAARLRVGDPAPLAGQCRYIFLFWVLYLRCRSLSHFCVSHQLESYDGSSGRFHGFKQTMASGLNEAFAPPPQPPLPRGLRNEDRGDPAVIRGLLQPEGATRTPVGEQRQSDRFLSLASSVSIIRIGNQTLPQLLSKCRIFLSRCLFCSLTHSC